MKTFRILLCLLMPGIGYAESPYYAEPKELYYSFPYLSADLPNLRVTLFTKELRNRRYVSHGYVKTKKWQKKIEFDFNNFAYVEPYSMRASYLVPKDQDGPGKVTLCFQYGETFDYSYLGVTHKVKEILAIYVDAQEATFKKISVKNRNPPIDGDGTGCEHGRYLR